MNPPAGDAHTMNAISFRQASVWLWEKRRCAAASSATVMGRPLLLGIAVLALLVPACGFVGIARAAPQLTVLFRFTNLKGAYPHGKLIADGAGNLYGTTVEGGANNDGVVFELSPPTEGETAWTEKVLFSFDGTNGDEPLAGLIADGAGNLYGTTRQGGENNDGVVFRLTPPVAGKKAWIEKVLLSFNGTNGADPHAGLLADGAGNLYGTTAGGGANSDGEVFELSPPASGKKAWTETVIHSFGGTDGDYPCAGLISDSAGNLYGTTVEGGKSPYYFGVVFELSPPVRGKGAWTETVLSTFAKGGALPYGGLIADAAGNLYGTTEEGGGDGDVFELSPPLPGETVWTENILLSFNGVNGKFPVAGLIADGAGNLYGTTYQGEPHEANLGGEVFELSPPLKGQKTWTELVLQPFRGARGAGLQAGLLMDGAGNLYGTTELAGGHNDGVVFKLTP
jgi:uncharacterized repeat protein (TIGR03803 family)